jgi:hypothetical protein
MFTEFLRHKITACGLFGIVLNRDFSITFSDKSIGSWPRPLVPGKEFPLKTEPVSQKNGRLGGFNRFGALGHKGVAGPGK